MGFTREEITADVAEWDREQLEEYAIDEELEIDVATATDDELRKECIEHWVFLDEETTIEY